jgi:hypothetical protein
MSIEYYTDLAVIDDDYAKNFERLAELKRLKADIETEISAINLDIAQTYPNGGTYTDRDGRELVVTIRRDQNAPKVDLNLLQKIDAELAGKIVKFAVDTDKVKEYIERGYFTNTPAEQALTLSYKKPWVQISTKKETDIDE